MPATVATTNSRFVRFYAEYVNIVFYIALLNYLILLTGFSLEWLDAICQHSTNASSARTRPCNKDLMCQLK